MFKDLLAKVKKQLHLLAFAECLVILFSLAAVFQKAAANSYKRVGLFFLSLIVSILIYVAFSILWQQLTKKISIAYGRFIRSTALVFIPIFSAIFLGERPSANVCLGILLILVGIFLIQRPSVKEQARETFREQQGATFFHFLGDAMTMVGYRDMPSRTRESFFFKYVHKKKLELEEKRRQYEIAKEKEREERAKREAEEAVKLAEAKRLQEEHERQAREEAERVAKEEASKTEIESSDTDSKSSAKEATVVLKSSAADIASEDKVTDGSDTVSSQNSDGELNTADELRKDSVVMAEAVVDHTAENSELKDIPDNTEGNDISDSKNVEGLEDRK